MKINIILIIFVVITSCTKTITDFEINQGEPKLVVNALFTPDSTIKIQLSQSRSIDQPFSTENSLVKNAVIQLSENDKELGITPYNNSGIYTLNMLPKAGKTYYLKASAEGFEDVTAEFKMPNPTVIENIEYDFIQTIDEYCIGCDNKELNFEITFQDKPGEDNYYVVFANHMVSFEDCIAGHWYLDTTEYGWVDRIEICDSLVKREPELTPIDIKSRNTEIEFVYAYNEYFIAYEGYINHGNQMFFSDKNLNGEVMRLKFGISEYQLKDKSDTKFNVYLLTIDKNLYNYYLTIAQKHEVEYDFLAEKVSLNDNIENGIGIFSGYSSDMQVIEMDSLLLSEIKDKFNPNGHKGYY